MAYFDELRQRLGGTQFPLNFTDPAGFMNFLQTFRRGGTLGLRSPQLTNTGGTVPVPRPIQAEEEKPENRLAQTSTNFNRPDIFNTLKPPGLERLQEAGKLPEQLADHFIALGGGPISTPGAPSPLPPETAAGTFPGQTAPYGFQLASSNTTLPQQVMDRFGGMPAAPFPGQSQMPTPAPVPQQTPTQAQNTGYSTAPNTSFSPTPFPQQTAPYGYGMAAPLTTLPQSVTSRYGSMTAAPFPGQQQPFAPLSRLPSLAPLDPMTMRPRTR